MKPDRVIGIAALLMATGIAAGAMGSHALRDVLSPRQLDSLGTAVTYQQVNALGLLLCGVLMRSFSINALRWVAGLLVAGILAFSGGIYLMLAGAPRLLGLVTPAGGVLLILAWTLLAWLMIKQSLIRHP
jgi:uncharacterized membrane protein YgdD (TMEM256/DUF423 family)